VMGQLKIIDAIKVAGNIKVWPDFLNFASWILNYRSPFP
jgi:hypothetical protein